MRKDLGKRVNPGSTGRQIDDGDDNGKKAESSTWQGHVYLGAMSPKNPIVTPKPTSKRQAKAVVEPASGTAAEYFVAGELLRRGVNAFLSIGAHKQIDVLVRTADGAVTIVDVKAVHGAKPRANIKRQASWNMPKVALRGSTRQFFYVLVWLGSKHGDYAQPEYFVVPAAWAAEKCDEKHATWVAGKPTRKAESVMRRLDYADVGAWRDRWELLISLHEGESR